MDCLNIDKILDGGVHKEGKMTKRPVFISNINREDYVEKIEIDFKWCPGFSVSQKQKSIESLHCNFKERFKDKKIIEISSKSPDELGIKLSAFNLYFTHETMSKSISVESAFQASKVFENGGPYLDLLNKTSKEAKQDLRLKESGELNYFLYESRKWELEPKTLFYDWLYIQTLMNNSSLIDDITQFDAFTDIEFNPAKSINCQARSVALFVSLHKLNLLDKISLSPEAYIDIVSGKRSIQAKQMSLFD
jgi:type I restriction enzyme M protein